MMTSQNPSPSSPGISISSISLSHFNHLLALYPTIVLRSVFSSTTQPKPSSSNKSKTKVVKRDHEEKTFRALDEWRYEVFPKLLTERRAGKGKGKREDGEGEDGYMEKEELEKAMDWKL